MWCIDCEGRGYNGEPPMFRENSLLWWSGFIFEFGLGAILVNLLVTESYFPCRHKFNLSLLSIFILNLDPSPYATTTLINPEGSSNLCCNRNQGPSLPLNPAPTEPPRHFLSSAAVMCQTQQYLVDATKQHPTGNISCNELLELDNMWHKQPHQKRIAAATLQQRRLRKAFLGICLDELG